MTASELAGRMTSAEFSEWLAFESEYGIPDGYFTAGLICTVVARSMGGSKVNPADFIPFFKPPRGAQSADAMAAGFRAAAAAHNRRASHAKEGG